MAAPPPGHLRRGLAIAAALALALVAVAVAAVAGAYDGRCGGYFPGLSAPRPCSLGEYLAGDLPALLLLLGASYWPCLLLVALPPAIGWWRDRRR